MAMQPDRLPAITPSMNSELDNVASSLLVDTNPEPEGVKSDPEDSPAEAAAEETEILDPEEQSEEEEEISAEAGEEGEDDPQESEDGEEERAKAAGDDDGEYEEVFDVRIDGKTVQVTLDDLKRDYSGRQAIDARIQAASEAKNAVDEQMAQIQQQAEQANNLAQLAYQAIVDEAADPDIDWEALHDVDPTEWAHQRELQRAKQEKAQMKIARLQQAAQENAQTFQQQQAEVIQQVVTAESAHLRDAFPVFSEEKAGAERQKEVIAFAVERYGKYGLTAEIIADVKMAAPLIMLNEIYDLVNGKDQAAVKAGRKRRIKRSVKPGGGPRVSEVTQSKKRRDRLRKRAEASGHPDDVAALMLQPKT